MTNRSFFKRAELRVRFRPRLRPYIGAKRARTKVGTVRLSGRCDAVAGDFAFGSGGELQATGWKGPELSGIHELHPCGLIVTN